MLANVNAEKENVCEQFRFFSMIQINKNQSFTILLRFMDMFPEMISRLRTREGEISDEMKDGVKVKKMYDQGRWVRCGQSMSGRRCVL